MSESYTLVSMCRLLVRNAPVVIYWSGQRLGLVVPCLGGRCLDGGAVKVWILVSWDKKCYHLSGIIIPGAQIISDKVL